MLKITLDCISFTYRFKESFLFGLKLFFFSPNMQWTLFNFKKTGTVCRTASFSFPKWHWFESKSGWACNAIKDVFLFIHRFMWIFGYTNKHINSQALKVPLLSLLCIFSINFPCPHLPCTLWLAHLPWQRSEQHNAAFPFDLTKNLCWWWNIPSSPGLKWNNILVWAV